ncbi:TIGR02646 family protein [Methylococcaceae bacterium WWC4]|nr:TIGR02646 family protein [Methylococcaceae bacterium WWC4]
MKKIHKGTEPEQLIQFRQSNPSNTWKQYTADFNRKKQIQDQLKLDQGGLCAYCEIDLKPANNADTADFRVEHFHPKHDSSIYNWHLDWQNLLACCHGGSCNDVADAANRHTSPDHSCDVPKANKVLDDIILNPIDLPAFPCLFKFNRADGSISVNIAHCQQVGVDEGKVQATIDELHLDAKRLRDLRKPILSTLGSQFERMVAAGEAPEDAKLRLARVALKKDEQGHWPKFFSAIRDYLGNAAEQQLNDIEYNG